MFKQTSDKSIQVQNTSQNIMKPKFSHLMTEVHGSPPDDLEKIPENNR